MKWQQLILDSFKQVEHEAERILTDLPAGDLLRQPDKDSNSIGWLIWHLTRVQDSGIAMMTGKEQVWIEGGWYKKFKRQANPDDIGSGHSPADVGAFYAPSVKALVDYLKAVSTRTGEFLSSLTAAGLNKKTTVTFVSPPPSVGSYLVMTISDNLQHIGQAGYIRGLLKGKGWQPY